MGDARQNFLPAKQTQLAKLYPGQPSFEIPLGTENKVDLRFANVRSVAIRVSECFRAAPLHPPLPHRQGEPAVGFIPPNRNVGSQRNTVYAYSESAKVNGLFLDARISCAGRRSEAEGGSPDKAPYSTAKRPNSQKPFAVAISVTVTVPVQSG